MWALCYTGPMQASIGAVSSQHKVPGISPCNFSVQQENAESQSEQPMSGTLALQRVHMHSAILNVFSLIGELTRPSSTTEFKGNCA